MKNKFVNKYSIAFVSVVVFFIVISAIFRALTPPLPPAQTIVTNTLRFTPQYSFENISLTIPPKMGVYSETTQAPSISSFAQSLATTLELAATPNVDNNWQNSLGTLNLFTEQEKYIIYIDSTAVKSATNKTLLSEIEAQAVAQDFIEKIAKIDNTTLGSATPIIITDDGINAVKENQQPNGYEFSAQQLVENYPYLSSDVLYPPVQVWITTTGSIVKARFYPQRYPTQKIETYNTLSLETIKQNIEKGIVTFIKAESDEFFEPSAKQLSKALFISAQIEYRKNSNNGYVLPYIRFFGTGQDQDGKSFSIEAISPLVAVTSQ